MDYRRFQDDLRCLGFQVTYWGRGWGRGWEHLAQYMQSPSPRLFTSTSLYITIGVTFDLVVTPGQQWGCSLKPIDPESLGKCWTTLNVTETRWLLVQLQD